MGVYIKGMEMPKNNTVLLRIYPKDKLNELYVEQLDIDGDTLNEYWAVELPQHGRLIDADAFLTEQRHLYCENCARRKGMKNGKMKFVYDIGDAPCRACGYGDVLDDIEDAPTIIPAEEGEI